MARKLPWATGSENSSAPARRKPAARPPKREPSVSSSDHEITSKKPVGQSKLKFETTPKKSRSSRSPSTSPVRGPPTAVPMRPGYDQDDIFIMVEDELQAVAQTFTHHLHAAEYKRLKRKAREAPPRVLPELNDDAPKDVKRKFEVMALQDKQRRAMDEDVETAGPSDPWSGTSLAGLMGTTNQPKRALTLSQEIPSSTRAASGFGRGEGESPRKKSKKDSVERVIEPEPARGSTTKLLNTMQGEGKLNRTEGELAVVEEKSLERQAAAPLVAKPTPSGSTINRARAKAATRPPKKPFSFDDDFDIDAISAIQPTRSLPKGSPKGKVKVEVKEENKKTKINDIPGFLY